MRKEFELHGFEVSCMRASGLEQKLKKESLLEIVLKDERRKKTFL